MGWAPVHAIGDFLDGLDIAAGGQIDQLVGDLRKLRGGLAVRVLGFPFEGDHQCIPH